MTDLRIRSNPWRPIMTGLKEKEAIICRTLRTGEEFTGTPTITLPAGGGVTLEPGSEFITTVYQTNDTIGAMIAANTAGEYTITITCETTTGEIKGYYAIWKVIDAGT